MDSYELGQRSVVDFSNYISGSTKLLSSGFGEIEGMNFASFIGTASSIKRSKAIPVTGRGGP
jgi:hypothetical protein